MTNRRKKKDAIVEDSRRIKRPELIEADSVGNVGRPKGPDAPKLKDPGPFGSGHAGSRGSGEPTMIPIENRKGATDGDMVASDGGGSGGAEPDMVHGPKARESSDPDMIHGRKSRDSADPDAITTAGRRQGAAPDMVSGERRIRSAADLQRQGTAQDKAGPDIVSGEGRGRGAAATMHSTTREPHSGADMARAESARRGAEATMHSTTREPRSGADMARAESARRGAEATMHSTTREPRAAPDMVRGRNRRRSAATMVPIGREVANRDLLFKPSGAGRPAKDSLQAFMEELQEAAERQGLEVKMGKPGAETEAGDDDLWVEFSKGVRALEVVFPPNELDFDRVVVRDALAPEDDEPHKDGGGAPTAEPVAADDGGDDAPLNTGGIAATLARVFGRWTDKDIAHEHPDEGESTAPVQSHTVLTSQYRDPGRDQGIIIELVRDEIVSPDGAPTGPAPAKLTPQEILRCFLPLLSSLHGAINRES